MQDGLSIYYNGNSLKRNVSTASIKKRIAQTDEIVTPYVVMPIIDKVFATSQCFWCNRKFEKYQITCQFCHNCQYCGMVAFSREQCQNCGNRVDDDLREEKHERQTIIF